jgi:hypothetical protein
MALALVAVAGCGLRPVYGRAAEAEAGAITVREIEGRVGYALRGELLQRIEGLKAPAGSELVVDVSSELRSLAPRLEFGGQTSRQVGTVVYTLTAPDGTVLAAGQVRREVDVAASFEVFDNISQQGIGQDRLGVALAEGVWSDVVIKLSRAGTR